MRYRIRKKERSIIIFYFTATGNCLDVAKRFDADRYSIPRVIREGRKEFESDKIGLVFPCYFMGTPVIVKDFLNTVSLKCSYLFSIITYGNFSFGAVNHFHETALKINIRLSYLNELKMIDNYLPIFDITKQNTREKDKKIEENLSVIIDDIKTGRQFIKKKSFFEKFASNKVNGHYIKSMGAIDRNFTVSDDCNECGICSKVCPAGNIIANPKPEYSHQCWECLACINNCPRNAIHDKREKSSARFRNRNVTLNEIISANNRFD